MFSPSRLSSELLESILRLRINADVTILEKKCQHRESKGKGGEGEKDGK